MELAPILVLGGLVVFVWLFLWLRQRQQPRPTTDADFLQGLPTAANGDAVLVAREHGQLVYANEPARLWLDMEGGDPNLEFVAQKAQPIETFLELFAGEMQASFQLGDRWVEGSSHRIPAGAETRTVVVMREINASTTHPDLLDLSLTMNVINEIGETVNAGLGVEQVMQTLITIVRKALSADAGEINLWDEDKQILVPQGWVGDVAYVLALAEAGGVYRVGEGISGWIAKHRKPVLVVDKADDKSVRPRLANTEYNGFVGVPLLMNDRFIGTFEFATLFVGQFGQAELALMQAVSSQIATSIYNAELYAEQVRRLDDIANLQQIAQDQKDSDDVSNIYAVLCEQIARLLQADICGVLLYDERKRALIAEVPFHGLPVQLVQSYSIPLPPDSPQREIFEDREYWMSNDLADEPLVESLRLTTLVNAAGVYNIMLMPLQIGLERIGMLQISNKRTHGGFTAHDIQNLRILSAQASVVVQNVRLYQTEQRVDTELSGLQEITHAIGALSHEDEFYSDINERIARLMGVAMSGVLLHDAAQNRLVSQMPFYGVPDALVQDYSIDLKDGTSVAEIWNNEDYWYSNRVPTDPIIYEAGLPDVMQAMGVTKTILAALSAGGRRIGMIQASNKLTGEDFSEKDARLLLIFATQAAAMIENARLYREMQNRANESDSVRLIAELAGSILTNDDSFQPVLAAIARLMNSPIVFINTLSQETGGLITDPRRVMGVELAQPYVQDIYSKHFEMSVVISRRPFLTNDILGDERVLPSYQEIAQHMGLERAVMVPLAVGDRSLGELGVANRAAPPYNTEDRRLLMAVAIQVASALDRLRLHEATGQNLSRRLQELDAISRVSNELNVTLEFDRIMDVIRQEALQATDASGCTVALLVRHTEPREGEAPTLDRRLGDRMATTKVVPIELEAARRGTETVIVDDYAQSDLLPMPANVRSAVAAAITYADMPVGVIHIYHESPNHFDAQAATFLMTLAAKASLGYANALRYQENLERSTSLRKRVEQLNQIFELGQMLQGNIDPVTMLEAIAYSVQQSAGFDIVLMTLADNEAGVLRRVAQAGLPIDMFEKSKANTMPLANLDKLFQDDFRVSESYFFPLDKLAKWYVEGAEVLGTAFDSQRSLYPRTKNDWRDGDMLIVPMHSASGKILGAMSLDRPFSNARPDRASIEILEIFAHQAATTIENAQLYRQSVHNAEQEARLNEVMEAITSTLDVNEIVETVARGALRLAPFSRMTVALLDSEQLGFDMLSVAVGANESLTTTRERRADLDKTVMGRSFEYGQDYIYHVSNSQLQLYSDLRDWNLNGEQTSLVVPLLTGGLCLGSMHFGSDEKDAEGFEEYRPLLKRIANLAAVAIQNARLFNQAVNLRLFNESVVESIQQGIVVLDRTNHIVSTNDFMRKHFGWDSTAMQRDLFDYRPDLAFIADDLSAVVEGGKPRERINQRTATADGTRVENFYLYPLLSAESTRGVVILFEDVTERARLEQDIEARANQLAVLTEVSSRITASLNRDEVIELALDQMSRVIPYDTMTLWQRHDGLMTLEGARGLSDDSTAMMEVQIDKHERVSKLVETQGALSVSRLQGWDRLPGESGAKSWLGVPLIREGEVVGMIALCKTEPGFYDAQSEQAAFAFANQVAVTLINSELFSDAQRRTERLSLLNRVSLALAQSLDTENILEIALREISQMLHVDKARAYILEREIRMGQVVVEYPRRDQPGEPIEIQSSAILQYVSRNVQPLIFENVLRAEGEEAVVSEIRARGVMAYIAIPIAVSGRALGAFELDVYGGLRHFEPEQIDLGLIIANQAAIAVQNANLLEQTLVRTRELETLLEAAQATSFTLDLDEVFQNAARLTLQALDMDDCVIMLFFPVENMLEVQMDMNRYGTRTELTPAGTRIPLKRYPARALALVSRQVVIINRHDKDADPRELDDLERFNNHARMLVPLVARDQSMGILQIDVQAVGRSFSHRDIRMAQALAAQAATAIENARLSTETAARVEELLVINDLSRAISSTMDIDSMIRIVRDQVPSLTDADELYLALFDADSGMITFPMAVRSGKDVTIAPRKLSDDEVSFVIRHRRLLSLGGDFSLDEMRRNLRIVTEDAEAVAYLGVPLIAGDQVLGVLAVCNTSEKRTFGLNDQRVLTTIASQLGAAIQNANLYHQISNFADDLNRRVESRTLELQQERDRLDALYRITSELARTLDMDRVLSSALEMVVAAINADEGVILLIDPMTNRLYNRASYLEASETNGRGEQRAHPAELLGTWLVKNVRSVVVDDLHTMPYWLKDRADTAEWHSALAVVLETNDDPQGVMVFLSRRAGVFTEPHLRLVSAAANQVATAINNADLYNLIRDQAERLGTLLRAEQEEAEKSTAILESIADGVILADARGKVVLFNNAAERILTMPRDRILGQPFRLLETVFTGKNTDWLYAVGDWVSNPQGYKADEFIVERLEVGGRIINVRLSPVQIGDQLLGTVSVFRDITRDVEVDRMKSEFISNVSHELRTPMTSIKGYADLLLMGGGGSVTESQKQFVNTIKSNADRLSVLVNDLLNISKLDSGAENLDLTDVDVAEVVNGVMATMAGRAQQDDKHLTVEVDVEPNLPLIHADRDRITQIVTNVVDNAFNYTYAGGRIDVSVGLRTDKPHVLIVVRDTGIGIPAEFQSRVYGRFERFEQHALVMEVAGTGLGLSIAKHLVEMHHGDIWFESEVNKGTTFYISLPAPALARNTQELNVADGQQAGQD